MESDHFPSDNQNGSVADIHSRIAHQARLLWDIQKLRIAVQNRKDAIIRDGLPEEWTVMHQDVSDVLKKQESAVDRQLAKIVREHFMADWIEACPGLGYGGFGRIIGVTGSLDNFANVAKLWKFMGLHVENGTAPKRRRGHVSGWSTQGRVVAHQIGDAIVKLGRGKYRELYDTRKAKMLGLPRKAPSGCPMGQEHRDKSGNVLQCVKEEGTSAHLHNDALRVAIKEMLKDLWVEWHRRRANRKMETTVSLPVADAAG